MVCEAMGKIKYGDKGNMTKDEIDQTMAIFTKAKKAGQFRAFWKSFDESVNLMASGEVVIQSCGRLRLLRCAQKASLAPISH